MAAYIDGRLIDQIHVAGQSGEVGAIIVVKDEGAQQLADDDGGLARQVVEGATERTGCRPSTVRYFPRANAAVLVAGGRFLQEILSDWRMTVASATDTNVLAFPER